MSKVDVIQTSFSGGEFGPSLYGRTDIAQYANACSIVENFIPRSYGPAISTPGTTYINTVSNNTLKTRLIKFIFNRTDAYVIEMGRRYFRFYTNGGVVITTGTTPFTLSHVYTEDEISDVQYAQLNDVIYLSHPDRPPQKLTRISAVNWTISDFAFIGGPFLDDNKTSVTLAASATTGTVNITASTTGIFTLSSGSTKGHVDSYWKIGGLAQTNTTTGLQEEGYVRITHVINSATATAVTIKNLKSTSATTMWAEGAWSAVRGYPARVKFHERRLWFGRTDYEPQKVWGSKTFEFENFALDTQAEDDGLNLPLASNESNEIQWLASGKSLIPGTFGSVFVINSRSSDPITPENANASEEVTGGASSVPPRKIGNFLYYVQRFGRKLRELFYNFDTDSFKAVDRTILSPHILSDGIVDMDATTDPETILYCVLTNGTLATMTREVDQEVTAWARQTTNGTYCSVAVIPSQENLYDEVWVIVQRWINGSEKRYIEMFAPLQIPTRQDACIYSHSALTYNAYDTATTSTITISVSEGGHPIVTAGNVVINNVVYKLGGGSAQFDGTGDFLTSVDHADWQLGGGTGSFTIDKWVRFTSIGSDQPICSQGTGDDRWALYWDQSATQLVFETYSSATLTINIRETWSPSNNIFYHVEVVRSSNTWYMFVDGTQLGTEDTNSATIPNISATLNIGKLSVGTPSTDLDNSVLMLHLDGADASTTFTDEATTGGAPHTVSGVGNAQIDTAQSKFSGASLLLDGTGDYLSTADSADWNLGSGDFTIDFWLRFNDKTNQQGLIVQDGGAGNRSIRVLWKGSGTNAITFGYTTDGTNFTTKTFNWTPADATWYHLAIIRNGADLKVFIDGTQIGSTENISTDVFFNSTASFWIGSGVDASGASTETFNGWIDEFRMLKGLAYWTSNFTPFTVPYTASSLTESYYNGFIDEFRISDTARNTSSFTVPTSEYAYDSNTKLLLHFNTNFKDSAISTSSITVTSSGPAFSQSQVGKRLRAIDLMGDTVGEGTITATVSTTSLTLSISTQFNEFSYAVNRWGISTSSVTGLDHLEGELVTVLADGTIDEAEQLITSGVITLSTDYFIITAGLPYEQIIQTLPREIGSQRGTSQGKVQKINEVAFKVNRSYKHFESGGDEDNTDIITPTESTIALFTGVVPNISHNGNYEYGAQVYLKNSVPLPIELLSIITSLTTYDK